MKYENPIIKGFNPDPSICAVGDDYYIINSTFEFFPGMPVYHSKNLANWELINYCLKTPTQLKLGNCRCSGGIYAPTIRYHKGTFYVVVTNVDDLGNMIVKTDDIYGDWSEPVWVAQRGIDPSILFADDKVYFASTHVDENGVHCIGCCEIDIETGEMLTETKPICYGTGGKWCEGPHMYKIGDYYYLFVAEGGTEFGHYEAVLRSRDPYGPYEESPYGHIISHRDFGRSVIQATGHTDLTQDANGNWWLVNLGVRKLDAVQQHNLGRETFISQVIWTDDLWPVLKHGKTIALEMDGDLPFEATKQNIDFKDDFNGEKLHLNWNFVRNPKMESYKIDNGLTLISNNDNLNDYIPTFIGIRQKEFNMEIETKLDVKSGTAGLSAYYNMAYHYDICVEKTGVETFVAFRTTIHGMTNTIKKVAVKNCENLKIVTGQENYEFFYLENGNWQSIGKAPTVGLCTEGTMMNTFTGTYIGLFAENGTAKFNNFSSKEI